MIDTAPNPTRLDREHRRHCRDCGQPISAGSKSDQCQDCYFEAELRAECAFDARDDGDLDDEVDA